MYVFQDALQPNCPIILHFPLINECFKNYKAPGVQREESFEKDFANFYLFEGDDAADFSTFRFQYDDRAFERLASLTGEAQTQSDFG